MHNSFVLIVVFNTYWMSDELHFAKFKMSASHLGN